MEDWRLSKAEYDILLSYIGCGDILNADILVFGNEEGTGGYTVTENVKARTRLITTDESSDVRNYCIEANNWREGFYYPDFEGLFTGYEKKHSKGFTKGVFNAAIARLCLAHERNSQSNWFEGSPNTDEFCVIKEYIGDKLYKPKTEGIQTALIDWRPLPRSTERKWYPNEYGAVALSPEDKPNQGNPYLAAFNKPKGRFKPQKYSTSSFSDFKEDTNLRARIIKNALTKSRAQILLGIGGAAGFKKDALELMFGKNLFSSIPFSCDMRNSKGQLQKAFKAEISLDNRVLYIFLIPFPSAGLGFISQENALGMLAELSDKYLKPILMNKN
ncbi:MULTISPECIES: hypothetical protein [Paenibacillus]|uniref:Uncharacterized protein n=1 Tax=Paenibacillus amylolyticus TaxID=1451 RepID=A0ABD8B380_PAEAM